MFSSSPILFSFEKPGPVTRAGAGAGSRRETPDTSPYSPTARARAHLREGETIKSF